MSRSDAGGDRLDAIVVGANVAGLITARCLVNWGYRTVVVERAPAVGGVDGSFRNTKGRWFDFGLHALDHMRSELTTRFFEQTLGGRVHPIERRRAIVLRNELIPYNTEAKDWPHALRSLLAQGGERSLRDDIGAQLPTRRRIARCYGTLFADLVFDEILASYPADQRHLRFGVPEERLLVNIYPWFFPRAERARGASDPSRTYQDAVREQPREYMLYPDEGYFGAFPEAIARGLVEDGARLLLGAADLHVDYRPETRRVEGVLARGERLAAPRVYWCGPPAALCALVGVPVPDATPDTFVLGSFQLAAPVRCDYSELILGDPAHAINRISFPGKLAGGRDDLAQVEFAFPTASDAWHTRATDWRESWTRSLERLGVLAPGNRVIDFHFRAVPIFYNVYGAEGRELPSLDFSERLGQGSNLRPVLPTYQKVNINTRLPQIVQFMAHDLSRAP